MSQHVTELINGEHWAGAERILQDHQHLSDSNVDYLFGCLYNSYGNPNKDPSEAKKYFGRVVDSNRPIDRAFLLLSQLEENKDHALRILKRGLKIFPRNESLFFALLQKSSKDQRAAIYQRAEERGAVSPRMKIVLAETKFTEEDFSSALELLEGVELVDAAENWLLDCIRGFAYYELKDYKNGKRVFLNTVEADLNHRMTYVPHFGLILNLLADNDIPECERLIAEINPEECLDGIIYEGYVGIIAGNYMVHCLDTLSTRSKNPRIQAICKGLLGMHLYDETYELEDASKAMRSRIIKNLEAANKQFPKNTEFCSRLCWAYSKSEKTGLKAWKYMVQYALNCADSDDFTAGDCIETIEPSGFQTLLSEFHSIVGRYSNREKLARTLLSPIIERLSKDQRFEDITTLAAKLDDNSLSKCGVLFEIAYAFGTGKSSDSQLKAKKYYEMYLKEFGEDASARNNLGCAYDVLGETEKAYKCFEHAHRLDPDEELYKNNLQRLKKILDEKVKEDSELKTAAQTFRSESPYVQKKVMDFLKHRDADGHIVCSYRQAPQFFKMAGSKASDFLNNLLLKKYLLKVTNHKYNTPSNVYRCNPFIETVLQDVRQELEQETYLLELCDRLNSKNLSSTGYNAELIGNLTKVSSEELRSMLNRDIKETAIAIILGQHKSALILCGSIIEAILMDKILCNGKHKRIINGKPKDVVRMDLNELLDAAEEERIIDSTMSHLAHGVRGYRNLIHPGVEQRKTTLQVNEDNVNLAWSIVKKLLYEIQ